MTTEELPEQGDDDEDEGAEPVCRTCGEPYGAFGDGWDGECPDCADKSYAKEEGADDEADESLSELSDQPKTLFKDSYGYEAEVDHSADDEASVGCGSCAWHGRYDQTVAIGLCSLTPGDPSPSGRCPECDSLCYLDAVEEKNKVA